MYYTRILSTLAIVLSLGRLCYPQVVAPSSTRSDSESNNRGVIEIDSTQFVVGNDETQGSLIQRIQNYMDKHTKISKIRVVDTNLTGKVVVSRDSCIQVVSLYSNEDIFGDGYRYVVPFFKTATGLLQIDTSMVNELEPRLKIYSLPSSKKKTFLFVSHSFRYSMLVGFFETTRLMIKTMENDHLVNKLVFPPQKCKLPTAFTIHNEYIALCYDEDQNCLRVSRDIRTNDQSEISNNGKILNDFLQPEEEGFFHYDTTGFLLDSIRKVDRNKKVK